MKTLLGVCILVLVLSLGFPSGKADGQTPKRASAPSAKGSGPARSGVAGLTWERNFQDGVASSIRAVLVLRDGSIVVANDGEEKNPEPEKHADGSITVVPGKTHMMVRRLDRNGNQLWVKDLVAPPMRLRGGPNRLYSLAETRDGDLVVAGFYTRESATSGSPGSRFPKYVMEEIGYLARLAPDGKLLWQKDLTTPFPDNGAAFLQETGHEREYGALHAVVALPDGIAAAGLGYQEGFVHSFLCVRLRNDGTVISKSMGDQSQSGEDRLTRALALPDGSFVAAYATPGTKQGEYFRATMVRFDPDGRQVWRQSWPVEGHHVELTSLAVDAKGDYFLAGIAHLPQDQPWDSWLARIAPDGRIVWSQLISEDGWTLQIHALCALRSGDIAAVGVGGLSGSSAGLVMRIAADGNILWKRKNIGSGRNYAVAEAPDGQLIVGGEAHTPKSSGSTAWVFKIAPGGR